MLRSMIENIKKKWKCKHNYQYISSYKREPYTDFGEHTITYPLGFIIKCKECGKKKDVGKDWCKKNRVEGMPEIVIKTRR